ncbi:MAG TPA: membrane protein insertase YidC [Stellaceae bacterium]
MDQQRNLIIAIALSIAILVGFEYFFGQRQPVHRPAPATQTTAPSTPSTATPSAPGTATAPEAKPRDAVLAGSPRVAIDTPSLHGSISLIGARLDDLILPKYRETIDPHSPPIVLLSPDGSEHAYFVEHGWVTAPNSTVKAPDGTTRWTASQGALTPQHPIDLTWDNGSGVRFIRHYAVDDNYMFTVTETVENKSGNPITLYPYALVSRTGNPITSSTYILHEGPIGVLDGTLKEIKYKDLTPGKPEEFKSTGGWLGITDKYWLTALIPDQQETLKARFTALERNKTEVYQVDYTGSERVVPAGGSVSTTERLFAGAKEVHLLDSYQRAYGIPLFDHAIDFGWFYWITKPIFLTLDFFYQRIGNFGVSILLLTVIIKLIFFPLANKSYRAMSKMKLLQPEMEKLRERFGEDKARLQQEMMALYKRVGANPMAGCLPIVIQIPVFFSLYKVLYVTIEMRHAPFFGWIHDLSAPDPTTFLNLFGALPYTAPPELAFLHIGAWPLIMGVTMFLQQKLNPQPADPVQAKMFMILPVVFTYMLSQFPAGLVIYWAWNNLLSIAQQWLIMRRSAPAVPAKA